MDDQNHQPDWLAIKAEGGLDAFGLYDPRHYLARVINPRLAGLRLSSSSSAELEVLVRVRGVPLTPSQHDAGSDDPLRYRVPATGNCLVRIPAEQLNQGDHGALTEVRFEVYARATPEEFEAVLASTVKAIGLALPPGTEYSQVLDDATLSREIYKGMGPWKPYYTILLSIGTGHYGQIFEEVLGSSIQSQALSAQSGRTK
jgi:hypothetical protein